MQDQIDLMLRDMEDTNSDLYSMVFLRLGKTKEEFIKALTEGIEKANEPSFYGGYDTVYAGYTGINGRQIYFKFSAPEKEMQASVGSAAPFLDMYCGGVYLAELSPEILFKYVMPFYYKEFGTYSKAYADNVSVKAWHNFMVSAD